MDLQIIPSQISGEITAPPSKSFAHRLIIASCLSKQPTVIKNVGDSEDVKATVNCLNSLGFIGKIDGNDYRFIEYKKADKETLDCKESGSTLRFMLPICCALGVKATFIGSEKLLSRPSEKLIETLNKSGADINGFTVNGKIDGDEFIIDGSISSQYVSGLLLALPLLGKNVKLKVIGEKVSSNYIDITVAVLKSFGIKIKKRKYGYRILKSEYKSKGEYTVEGDYSGASFILSLGAIGGKVKVFGLNKKSCQGDRAIVKIIKKFGAKIYFSDGVLICRHNKLKGITANCRDIPDIVQIITVISAFAEGKTTLFNIRRLKYKESDRLKAITKMLTTADIAFNESENSITVYGGTPKAGVFYSDNDHRTAMSATVLATFTSEQSEIIDAMAVKKSYPNFYSDYKKLGGKTDGDL